MWFSAVGGIALVLLLVCLNLARYWRSPAAEKAEGRNQAAGLAAFLAMLATGLLLFVSVAGVAGVVLDNREPSWPFAAGVILILAITLTIHIALWMGNHQGWLLSKLDARYFNSPRWWFFLYPPMLIGLAGLAKLGFAWGFGIWGVVGYVAVIVVSHVARKRLQFGEGSGDVEPPTEDE